MALLYVLRDKKSVDFSTNQQIFYYFSVFKTKCAEQLGTLGDRADTDILSVGVAKLSAAAQAVGGAVGHNPISILIPCHRVLGADGSLTGYAGGLENKEKLLQLEGIV